MAGALQALGMHVPQPEVRADETNPKGFAESKWVVDFHHELLQRCNVQVSDARPTAWYETGKASASGITRARLTDWLGPHFKPATEEEPAVTELVIKDPRLAWFLGLWKSAALRSDAESSYVTMLRHVTEVVGSKQRYYAPGQTGSAFSEVQRTAAWVNMMLHTERATRDGARAFVRYDDLLTDWTVPVFRLGQELDLEAVKAASANHIRKVHQFIDPDLHRVQSTWDDVEVPGRLREIAEETWRGLTKLAEPGGDTPDVHALLDEVREAYVAFYDEAEAVAQSSVIAARRQGEAGAAGARGAPAGRRRAAWSGRDGGSARRWADERNREASRLPDPLGLGGRPAHPRADLCLPGQERGPQPALGAAADVRGGPARRAGRQPVRRRHRRGRPAGGRGARGRARFTLACYPFQVARAGTEHLDTPPDSVHSLTYFYNWSFSHVRTSYSMKWDGDMVLSAEGVELLRDLSWQLEDSNAVVAIPRHPMSVESESVAWLDLGYRFLEPWVYPMGPEFTFVKAFEWEVREFPPTPERIVAPEGMCVELKWLDQDEFAHWSDTDFDAVRTPRKARELEVYRALREGRGHEVEGLKRIEAPAGVHVVDHVTKTWMQLEPRPLTLRLELQEPA